LMDRFKFTSRPSRISSCPDMLMFAETSVL
jgi:hypothetical protein